MAFAGWPLSLIAVIVVTYRWLSLFHYATPSSGFFASHISESAHFATLPHLRFSEAAAIRHRFSEHCHAFCYYVGCHLPVIPLTPYGRPPACLRRHYCRRFRRQIAASSVTT